MYKLRALWFRLCAILFSRRAESELATELEGHLQLHIEDGVRAGLSPDEARRQALIKLGGMEQTKIAYRERRGLPRLETPWQDIGFGLRILWKKPGFTTIAVLTLALGIGATTAIFSVVKAVLLAPLPYKDSDCIVAVWTTNPERGGKPLPSTPGDFVAWKKSGIFEDLAPSYDDESTLSGQGAPQFLVGYAVSANYLRILGVEPQIGRLYTDQEDTPGGPKVAILSDHLWRTTLHADPNIVGKPITLDGTSHTVLGVMPPAFNYPATIDFWEPIAIRKLETVSVGENRA